MKPVRALVATAVSVNVSDGARFAAVPLLALTVTKNPALIAGLSTAQLIPFLLVSLFAGVAVDRVQKRLLLAVSIVVRVVLLATLVVAVASDSLSILLLYACVMALGVAEVVYDVTCQSFVPELVAEGELASANVSLTLADLVARLVGPLLGTFSLAVASGLPFVLAAALCALVLPLVAALPGRQGGPRRDRQLGTPFRGVLQEIVAGLNWLRSNAPVRTLTLMSLSLNFFVTAWSALLVLYVTEQLSSSEAGYGWFLALGGLSGIISGLLVKRMENLTSRAALLTVSVAGTGLVQLGLAFATSFVIAAILMVIFSYLDALWSIVALTVRQLLVPPEMLGRINSAYRALGRGVAPLGAIFGGLVASNFGLYAPFLVGAPVLLVGAAAAWWYRPFRLGVG